MSARAVFVLPAGPDRLDLLFDMKREMKQVFEIFSEVNRTAAGARDGAVVLARVAQRFSDRCAEFAAITEGVRRETGGDSDARAAEKA